MAETRKPQEIVLNFNKTINSLLSKLEKRSTSLAEKADLDRLRQRINLLRKTHAHGGQALLEQAGPFLYKYGEKILNRDESFFINIDVRKEHGHEVGKDDEFVFTLVENIKAMYKKSKQQEKDAVYAEILSLYTDFLGYCMVVGCDPLNAAIPANKAKKQ